jgi:hypothetical protein
MTTQRHQKQTGSVLLTAILTLTILSMICGLSLYVTSQNANATSQTASWQAALSGAESGVEHAYYALNKSNWTGWHTVSGSPPKTQPSGGTTTTIAPSSGQYVYFTRTLQLSGEGGGTIKLWTTIDTAGLPKDHNGNQWYRVRATGIAAAPGPPRVSNQKRDNDLRKLSLQTDRISGLALTTPQAARMIEVIAKPNNTNLWSRGITLASYLTLNGTGVIDSFDSSSSLYSTNHLYDSSKHTSNADIGIVDSTGSDLKDRYVYGDITYSGPAIKNTSKVQGSISTPFSTTIPATSDPVWSAGSYTSYSGGGLPVATITAGTSAQPALIKVNGDFKVGSGQVFTIAAANPTATDSTVIIWVTGAFAMSGNGIIVQAPNTKVTWYVDKDISVGGDAYPNVDAYASSVNFIGVGTNNAISITGNSNLIATIDAPGYNVTLNGNGSYMGALIAKTLDIGGSAGFHYDEALARNGNNSSIDNFSYASWFEDNAEASRGITY